ncbi:hypothetical protein [Methylobacterium iners]|uniref:Integrase n=1 Tax=Methylobacterium iners TaxID=418707 RepID=A0ABQ4RT84_9HYPH|nr:hypothetical protein [Methylobacterium iners]GJD93980.1 hypothetical protein OCOJLMKI_1178 [Methylobacterium iners]
MAQHPSGPEPPRPGWIYTVVGPWLKAAFRAKPTAGIYARRVNTLFTFANERRAPPSTP